MKPCFHLKLRDGNDIKKCRDLDVNKRRLDRYKCWTTEDLANVRFVFVPVHIYGKHWTLLVADYKRRTITLLDSSTKCPIPKEKWIDIWRSIGIVHDGDWKVGTLASGKQDGQPGQEDDDYSCGAFVMLNAFLMLCGKDPRDSSVDDAKLCRMYALVRNITEILEIPIPGINLSCSTKECKEQSLDQVPCQGDCGEWFHDDCAEFDEDFICLDCRKKRFPLDDDQTEKTAISQDDKRPPPTSGAPKLHCHSVCINEYLFVRANICSSSTFLFN
eukprot:GHVL01041995.1.p1 GENE.GHVL01041995.1~~GHVL01041995.1.p1  ORF type:complete len:273 (+),score=21.08 GHVL01041995.1:553-1371(+)